ncbi:MAG: hypothetical protein Q4D54_05765 [Eubacteriales bacterium]|nr:hypothetical protein [Eubacteriales bacterium]
MSDKSYKETKAFLENAQAELQKLEQTEDNLDALRTQNKKLGRNITSEEKSIADEIAQTIKKRRMEITDSFDDRLDDNRSRKKNVSNKRDKKKNQRMNARIQDETQGTRDKIKELNKEMKALIKRDKAPSFLSSKMFFSLFMPRGIGETVTMLVGLLIYFIGIPSVFMLLVKNILKNKEGVNSGFWGGFVFVIVLILLAFIYYAIYNATKRRHADTAKQARNIYDQIKSNKRQIKDISKSISNDKDESMYKLDAYDEKLANLDAEAESINEEKKEKLRVFEEKDTQEITDEIHNRRQPAVENMKLQKQNLEAQIRDTEKVCAEQSSRISNEYASVIGEDLCKKDKIADLISFIEEGRAATVSEAIAIYRNPKSSK